MQKVDADEADALIGAWLMAQVQAGRLGAGRPPGRVAIAVDGKTLKGSWPELNTATGKVRLLSALVHGEGVIVGQRTSPPRPPRSPRCFRCSTRSPAPTAATTARPDLTGVVLTADALHVHRDNIEELTERGGDYVLTVKGNQPTLLDAVKNLFAGADGSFPP